MIQKCRPTILKIFQVFALISNIENDFKSGFENENVFHYSTLILKIFKLPVWLIKK